MVQVSKHSSSIDFYVKITKVKIYTPTCKKLQNQYSPTLFMTFYFEFKWLFINLKCVI